MITTDYTITFAIDNSVEETFNTINKVTDWWTNDLIGSSTNVNDVFTVHFGDVHVSTQKIIELIPNQKIVWLVTESKLNFIKDQQEWNNTTVCFELFKQGDTTLLHFTHVGLTPEVECYTSCTKGWDYFIKGSLYKLLTEGKGTTGYN
jgi:hypothetical protein